MKKLTLLIVIVLPLFFTSCKKVYRDEIFNGQYIIIYGEWRHIETSGGWTGDIISREEYTVRFTPIGKFSYNYGKSGIIIIKEQNENNLLIDFNSLFPKASEANIAFQGNDTMSISDTGADLSTRLFLRISK